MTNLLAWHKASPLEVFNPNVEEKNLKYKKKVFLSLVARNRKTVADERIT